MAAGNYFDSNQTITEHFQIETAQVIQCIDPTEMLQ